MKKIFKFIMFLFLIIFLFCANTSSREGKIIEKENVVYSVKPLEFNIDYSKFQKKEYKEIELCTNVVSGFSYEEGYIAWDKTSKQHEVISNSYVDHAGHFKQGDYYLVAMSSYYGEVGTKYKITLSNGFEFLAMKGDEKAEHHLINNCIHPDGSMIEFILDVDVALNFYGGDKYVAINLYHNWDANVSKIEILQQN